MKRKSLWIVCACLMLALAACGATEETPEPGTTGTPKTEPTKTATVEPTEAPEPTIEPTKEPEAEPTATAIPTETPEPTATSTPTPEPTATVAPTETPTPTPEPTATPTPEPSFDTSWASNEFEKLIPKPPVGESHWKAVKKDESTYKITTYGPNLNLSVFMDYVKLLSECGFTVEESMADYIYFATDKDGNEVRVLREADIHEYTVKKAK